MENIVLKASDGYALSLAVFEREHSWDGGT